MSSGLDWERFGVITGGDEVCILPPPTLSEKGLGIYNGLGGANPAVNTPRLSRGTRIESCDFIVLIGDP